jgi:hypothetical protein
MAEIHKYWLDIAPSQEVRVSGRLIRWLDVQMQGRALCIWGLLQPGEASPHQIRIIGTGSNADGVVGSRYLGTVQEHDIVLHVFADPI